MLAFVDPDVWMVFQSFVLIRPNMLDALYEQYPEAISDVQSPISHGFRPVLKILETPAD